ncbi:hypothetical protein THAOC_31142, partial [Thalassiosira oceanica]
MDASLPPRPSSPNNDVSAQRSGDSTNDAADVATQTVQEVPQGGMSAPTIRGSTDDDHPIPVRHVVDHEEEIEGPQLHDGPPGPPCSPRGIDDDTLTQRGETEFGRNSLDHPIDNTSTAHSTVGRSSVASAASMGPSMDECAGEGSASSGESAPPTSPQHTEEGAAIAAAGPNSTSAVDFVEAYMVDEAEETPGRYVAVAELQRPHDNTSTAHSTIGRSPVASAAAIGPSMDERVGEGR